MSNDLKQLLGVILGCVIRKHQGVKRKTKSTEKEEKKNPTTEEKSEEGGEN